MSGTKSEKRAARKEMVRQAELARQAKTQTLSNKFSIFLTRSSYTMFIGGIAISWLLSLALDDFSFSQGAWCSVYLAIILFTVGVQFSEDNEPEAIKRAKLLKEAKENKDSDSSGCMSIGGIFIVLGITNYLYSLDFDWPNLSAIEHILGAIAWTFAGVSIIKSCILDIIRYKKVLAEEASGATFVELPPDEGEEELARLIAEEEGAPFTNDSHPNNMDAENDYIDDPDYDYTPNRRNDRRVPTFALDSRPNNFDAENSYIDDPDYDRGQSRYNCHRSPAPKKNSRRSSNYSSSDDSFYDEVQY